MAPCDWAVSPLTPYHYWPKYYRLADEMQKLPKGSLPSEPVHGIEISPSDQRDRGDEDDAIRRTGVSLLDELHEKVVDDLMSEVDRAHALDLEIADLRKIADIWRDRELQSQHIITNLMGDKIGLETRIQELQARIDSLVKLFGTH